MGVGKREEEESKLLWRQQFPFISICKGLGELQMEAAQAGSLLGLKIELCSTFPAEAPGRAEGVRTQVARGEETDQVLRGGEPRGALSQERTPWPPLRPAQPDPGSGKVEARRPVSPEAGGSLRPLRGLRTGSLSLERGRDGVERRAGWRAGPRRRGQVSRTPRGGGGRGPHRGWGGVCVLRAGLRAGPGRTAGRGEGAAFPCDSGLTQCHF